MDAPGALALVVAPQVSGYILHKVLMDGGSSINILYWDTFIVTYLHLKYGKVPVYSANPWIVSFAHTV